MRLPPKPARLLLRLKPSSLRQVLGFFTGHRRILNGAFGGYLFATTALLNQRGLIAKCHFVDRLRIDHAAQDALVLPDDISYVLRRVRAGCYYTC